MTKLFIVYALDPCGYDSYPVSYHLTKKGAWKAIHARTYDNWMRCRYITPGGYDDDAFYISEGLLSE